MACATKRAALGSFCGLGDRCALLGGVGPFRPRFVMPTRTRKRPRTSEQGALAAAHFKSAWAGVMSFLGPFDATCASWVCRTLQAASWNQCVVAHVQLPFPADEPRAPARTHTARRAVSSGNSPTPWPVLDRPSSSQVWAFLKARARKVDTLHLDGANTSSELWLQCLSVAQNAASLTALCVSHLNSALMACPLPVRAPRLALQRSRLGDSAVEWLASQLAPATHASFHDVHLLRSGDDHIETLLAGGQSLRSLEIRDCCTASPQDRQLTPRALTSSLLSILHLCPGLHTLRLTRLHKASGPGASVALRRPAAVHELRSLSLQRTPLSVAGVRSALSHVGKQLHSLTISHSRLLPSDGGEGLLQCILTSCPKLKRLHLDCLLYLRDVHLQTDVKHHPLQHLSMIGARAGADAILPAVMCMPQLATLTLKRCSGVTPHLLQALGDACPALRLVDVHGCRCMRGAAAAQQVASAVPPRLVLLT